MAKKIRNAIEDFAQNMSHLRFLPTRWNGVDIEKYKFTSKPQLREYQNAQFVGSVCLQSRKRTTSEPGLWTQARDTSYIPGHSLRAGCFPEKPKRENGNPELLDQGWTAKQRCICNASYVNKYTVISHSRPLGDYGWLCMNNFRAIGR
ncbi:uncharacterized protein LOC111263120 isoform X2 [Varroa jacobsoni]|uniref:uncharacterized protein LOC111263120 isoform X2 n=1 Tax=Varroa jacobsoni TaxID=62625 RepID=UPI000BF2A305|nr:uncharacterized protein LOC111263120 isoform X2 [Varroa jacobsoni]